MLYTIYLNIKLYFNPKKWFYYDDLLNLEVNNDNIVNIKCIYGIKYWFVKIIKLILVNITFWN